MEYYKVGIEGDPNTLPSKDEIAQVLMDLIASKRANSDVSVKVDNLFFSSRDMSTKDFKIDGPYATREAHGLSTPIYNFAPGAERQHVGNVEVSIKNGMTFDIKLEEEHADVAMAVFEVPMRFAISSTKPH